MNRLEEVRLMDERLAREARVLRHAPNLGAAAQVLASGALLEEWRRLDAVGRADTALERGLTAGAVARLDAAAGTEPTDMALATPDHGGDRPRREWASYRLRVAELAALDPDARAREVARSYRAAAASTTAACLNRTWVAAVEDWSRAWGSELVGPSAWAARFGSGDASERRWHRLVKSLRARGVPHEAELVDAGHGRHARRQVHIRLLPGAVEAARAWVERWRAEQLARAASA